MIIVLFTLTPQADFIDPYNYSAPTYTNGLDPIATAIVAAMGGGPPTTDILNTAIINYIQPLYYSGTPTLDQLQKLNAVLGNFYNAFISPQQSAWRFYSPAQQALISTIYAGIATIDTSTSASGSQNYGTFAQQTIATSGLTAQEQAPLFLSLDLAGQAWNYFYAQILGPLSSDWANFLDK